jgi:hypothetical protein
MGQMDVWMRMTAPPHLFDAPFVWLISHQPADFSFRTNQQPTNSIFLSEQISTIQQPLAKRTG